MKIKTLMLMMIIAATAYAEKNSNISKNPHYRVAQSTEFFITIEQKGYDDFLRVVDEENRRKGINSNYSNKATEKERRLHDKVDLIPVAHVIDDTNSEWKAKFGEPKMPVPGSEASRNFHRIEKLATEGTKAIEKEDLEKTGYQRSGYTNRFYFGNGNTAKDIVYLNKENFTKKVKETETNNNKKYLVEGMYKNIGQRNDDPNASLEEKGANPLGIVMDKDNKGNKDEYYSKIQGKSRKEVAAFLKQKLEEKGITGIIQKGDELYTKDSKGREWKVLWSLEPISLYRTTQGDFKDTVLTKVYIYNEFDKNSKTDSVGRKLYTKDNSIYLEDKYEYDNDVMIKEGYNDPKKLSEMVKEAKRKAESGEAPTNNIEQFYNDKKNLSEADFKAKWVTPFENGDFDRDLNNMKKEITEKKAELAKTNKEKEEIEKNQSDLKKNSAWKDKFQEEATFWKYKSDSEKNAYLATLTEVEKKVFLDYIKYSEMYSEKNDKINNLDTDIQQNIPKKYGFYKSYWGGNPADEKWLNRVIQDSKIIRDLLGKNIEFRGRGRIEGTIDLGEGDNQITITEQFTGRYGTNIVLGPYAKILNVRTVLVGGQLGSDTGASTSGRASLTLDIDPSKKSKEGYLNQHALKDSDPNIIFRSISSEGDALDNRNKFQIEMMTSRIGEDSIIDIGRKIDYKYHHVVKGDLDMTIPFTSDSIAHSLIDNKKFSKNGTSLLEVKIKDKIKRLTDDENKVYKSIKNAKKLSLLQETLTTTNKKTVFSTVDDEKQEKKVLDLAIYLKTKKSKDLLKDLAQFNLSDTEKQEMMNLIDGIKSSKTVQDNIKKEKDLNDKLKAAQKLEKTNEYKSLNLGAMLEKLKTFNIEDLRNKKDDENVRNENTAKIKEIVNNIDMAVLNKLKDDYPELNLNEVLSAVNAVKNRNVADKWDFGFLLNELEALQTATKKQLNDYGSKKLLKDLENIDKDLADTLEKYSGNDVSDAYQKLKGKIYYTMREEEVLAELKNMLNQLSDRKIYSKLNKISKNEISTYTTIPFEVTHALTEKKHIARGGFISNRTVQENFKGNIYTAYGLYETTANSNTKYGILFGGANTKHNEVYKRTLSTVATESKIKGVSAYVGGYFNKPVVNNLNWITGIGTQYGRYKVKRDMKNNYQELQASGKVNTASLNTYSGFIINYPIQEDVFVQLKGLLAYTMVKQSKVNESGDLPLDIKGKTYHYVDGETGISFNKIFYGDDEKSSISAGAYGILGISGYKNSDMEAKINGSSSSFGIKGDRVKKDAVKIHLDYNVQTDIGYIYGLEGTYITNSKENNVKIGIKAGYVF